jgi:hypothetical protein
MDGGRFSTLVMGIIESAPFEKRRNASDADTQPAAPATQSAVPTK